MTRIVGLPLAATLALLPAQTAPPTRGLTAASEVARAYDLVLDATFDEVPAQLTATCGPAAPEVCQVLETVSLWWQIALEPESRLRDPVFTRQVDAAIAAADAWTSREPERAEAWFYLGAASGVRAQWKVQRRQRLSAARDGKLGKTAFERALALDPEMHDANFGLGMYRYYAATAPAILRMFRWLLLLPDGDRTDGLRRIQHARDHGRIVRGEADYQLHRIYLWYEDRSREALAIVQSLQHRYPRNPLFHHLEAEIHDKYFHDPATSLASSRRLLELARRGEVGEADLASVRARLNMAVQLDRLDHTSRAVTLLEALLDERPARPSGAVTRARRLLDELTR